MAVLIDIALLTLLVVVAVTVSRVRDLFAAVVLFSIYSFLSAALFTVLDAPDVAITEAAVGAGMSTVLMLVTLSLVGRTERPRRHPPWVAAVVVLLTGASLVYGLSDAPLLGDPAAPIHAHVAPYYLTRTPEEIAIPNVVTAVLASYRGHDTLGEVSVVFTAGVGVLALVATLARKEKAPLVSTGNWQHPTDDPGPGVMQGHVILRIVAKLLLPAILMFALYVQGHGEISPGGGFSAGVIFGTGTVLYALVHGVQRAREALPAVWLQSAMALGLMLYIGVGIATLLLGGRFLDYDVLSSSPIAGQHLGILLIELGVGLTVAAVMTSIFLTFANVQHRGYRL